MIVRSRKAGGVRIHSGCVQVICMLCCFFCFSIQGVMGRCFCTGVPNLRAISWASLGSGEPEEGVSSFCALRGNSTTPASLQFCCPKNLIVLFVFPDLQILPC
ncbi:hypothetical protein AMECASPLE_027350 [Ameca splendens]|uniref:Secreted protein n=1 Tax=Ameca splendens TaxID=208324 RepID=A0ABV0ZR59_9TELE